MGATGDRWADIAAHCWNLVVWCWGIECAHDRGGISVGGGSAEGICGCNDPVIGEDRRTTWAESTGVAGFYSAPAEENRSHIDGLYAAGRTRGDGRTAGLDGELGGTADGKARSLCGREAGHQGCISRTGEAKPGWPVIFQYRYRPATNRRQMDSKQEAIEAAGVVGEGTGSGLEQALWGIQTATDEPADISICPGALLDRNSGWQANGYRGPSSLVAPEHF